MSWMDSWSRPSKSQATPAPFYLLPGGEDTSYCKSCGRVISSRKSALAKDKNTQTPVKYCSSRCRGRKVSSLDKKIESAFVAFLNGATSLSESDGTSDVQAGHVRGKPSVSKKRTKGDARTLVSCSMVEDAIFSPRRSEEKGGPDPEETPGVPVTDEEEDGAHDTDNASWDGSAGTGGEDSSKDALDPAVLARLSIRSGTRVRPAQHLSEVNGSVGGEKGRAERIEEDEGMRARRLEGERRSEEREQVKRAARRGVVFGFVVEGNGQESKGTGVVRKKCEAVMRGKVVEPSFAKGDWSIRWRE